GLATGSSTQRPDIVPGVPIYLHSGGLQFLNPAAFALPPVGSFGNLGRGAIKGPAIKNVDFSVAKNWRLTERFGLQFRTEMFNAFNHVNFSGINTGLAFQNNIHDANFGKDLSGNFGRLTSDLGPRVIQFGLKFSF